MSRNDFYAMLYSAGWDDYINVSEVVAVVWIVSWLLARHAVRRSRVRFVMATLARGLGGALIGSDLFNLIIQIAAGETSNAIISIVGAVFTGLALALVDGDDWFSRQLSKAKKKIRAALAARRAGTVLGGARA